MNMAELLPSKGPPLSVYSLAAPRFRAIRVAFEPAGAGFRFLALPDRDGFLHPVDDEPAARERLGPVRTGHRDRDRDLTDDQASAPVLDRDTRLRPLHQRFL